ncbi:hypothetical protein AW008_07905 [Shigella sonnei]|nr:hypothetical protein AW008_07905 [Shigella sonnei]CSS56832.1 pdu/cob regulatory protein [Shigella sonnei]
MVDILNVDDCWQADPELLNEFRKVPEMDYSRVMASADLLKLIVENCLKKQLNFVVIKENKSRSDSVRQTRAPNPHDNTVIFAKFSVRLIRLRRRCIDSK